MNYFTLESLLLKRAGIALLQIPLHSVLLKTQVCLSLYALNPLMVFYLGFNQRNRTNILRDSLQGIGLHRLRQSLNAIRQALGRAAWHSQAWPEVAVYGQNFFFREYLVLLLRSFNWLSQPQPDDLGSSPLPKVKWLWTSVVFAKYATHRWVFNWITGDC